MNTGFQIPDSRDTELELISRRSGTALPEAGGDDRARPHIRMLSALARSYQFGASPDKALAVYDQCLSLFANHPDAMVRRSAAAITLEKAEYLRKLGRLEHAASAFDDLFRLFGSDPDPSVQDFAFVAQQRMTDVFIDLEQAERALSLWETLITQHRAVEDPKRSRVMEGLVTSGLRYTDTDRYEIAYELLEMGLRYFRNDLSLERLERIVQSLSCIGCFLGENVMQLESRWRAMLQGLTSLEQRATIETPLTDPQRIAMAAYETIYQHFCQTDVGSLLEQALQARVCKARLLEMGGYVQDAVCCLAEIANRSVEGAPPTFQRIVAEAEFDHASYLLRLAQQDSAVRSLEAAIGRWEDNQDEAIQRLVLQGLLQWSSVQSTMGQYAGAEDVVRKMLKRFGSSTEPSIRRSVMMALVELGQIYFRTERYADAADILGRLVIQHRHNSDRLIRYQWHIALTLYGEVLIKLHSFREALSIIDETLVELNQNELAMQPLVARQLWQKATCELELENPENAIRTLRQVLNRFNDSGEAAIDAILDDTIFLLGILLSREARKIWQERGREPGLAAFRRLRDKLESDAHYRANNRFWQLHRAYLLFALGDMEPAWKLARMIRAESRALTVRMLRSHFLRFYPLDHDRDFISLFEPMA